MKELKLKTVTFSRQHCMRLICQGKCRDTLSIASKHVTDNDSHEIIRRSRRSHKLLIFIYLSNRVVEKMQKIGLSNLRQNLN